MKKVIVTLMLVTSVLVSYAQLKVESNGRVVITKKMKLQGSWNHVYWDETGLCKSPVLYPNRHWYLQLGKRGKEVGGLFVHTIHYKDMWHDSDKRLKNNIKSMNHMAEKLARINSYTYNYKPDLFKNAPKEVLKESLRKRYGFLAQEVQKVFPELVKENENGMLAVDYVSMVPILTKVVNSQQKELKTLERTIFSQEKEIAQLKAILKKNNHSLNSDDMDLSEDEPILYDNTPNPVNNNTSIGFYIPINSTSARIMFTNLQGKEVYAVNITAKGKGNIIVNSSNLYKGLILYTLEVDQQIIDTKRMIVK